MSLVPQALQYLMDLMEGAESEAVRIRAVENVLDRAGLKVAEELAIIPQEASNASLDAAIAAALAARGHAVPAGDQVEEGDDDPEVLDAEVVEPGDTGAS